MPGSPYLGQSQACLVPRNWQQNRNEFGEVEPAFVTQKVTPKPSLETGGLWAQSCLFAPASSHERASLVLLLPWLFFFFLIIFSPIFKVAMKFIEHKSHHRNHFPVRSSATLSTFTWLCNHHTGHDQSSFHLAKLKLCTH